MQSKRSIDEIKQIRVGDSLRASRNPNCCPEHDPVFGMGLVALGRRYMVACYPISWTRASLETKYST